MTSFDLLHLSDLHISAKPNQVNPFSFFKADGKRQERERAFEFTVKPGPSSYDKNSLRFLMGTINSKPFHSLDLVIITGDLATTGMDQDLGPASFLLGNRSIHVPISNRIVGSLVSTNTLISLLPGNHDRYINNAGKPNCKGFENFFQCEQPKFEWDYWRGDSNGKLHHVVLEDGGEKLLIVSMDLSLSHKKSCNQPRPYYRYGQGKLSKEMEVKIVEYTNGLKDTYKTEAVIWCTHFPPHSDDKALRLLRGSKLISCAKKSGVTHILCGHTHINNEYVKNGINIHVVGTSCGADEAVHDFQRFNVTVDKNKITNMSKKMYACIKNNTWFNEVV